MPPRNLPRSPFAGIGAGSSIVANLTREPTTPIRASHPPVAPGSNSNTPRRHDGLPLTGAHPSTLAAFSDSDFTSSGGVSDSLSRAFFVDVILEGQIGSATSSISLSKSNASSAFEAWLGDSVHDYDADFSAGQGARRDSATVPKSSSGSSITAVSSSSAASSSPSTSAKPSNVDPSRLFGRVQELIDTERSYVKRVDVLHQKYAIPLRTLAKDRVKAIIPLYEAQKLFGNIGEIAGANRAFLNDLERLASQGHDSLRAGLGDVLYNHMSCFSCYTEYFANFEKAKHIERTLAKHRAFCDFTDRTRYSVTDIGNTGLRDLLMEPIQRIPRYKLLIDAILKHVEPRDPLRSRLEQAISLVSRIASCEADEKTRRAAILWSFSRNLDAFPAELISAHRRFIDCIDVDDFPLDASAASSGIAASFSGLKPIPCTLFLFDDRLVVAKRAHASTSGRKLVGLDDIGRLASQMKIVSEKSSGGSLLAPGKRADLAFRGNIGLMDVDAQDLGGADLQLTMLRQPSHVTGDKWTNRPLRQYVAVDTSASAPSTHASRSQFGSSSLDADVSAKLEKMRFLESLWKAKAVYKAAQAGCDTRCIVVPASRQRLDPSDAVLGGVRSKSMLQDARKLVYFHMHTKHSYEHQLYRSALAMSVDDRSIDSRTSLGSSGSTHPHAILDVSQIDEMEEEFVAQVRTKGAHDGDEVRGEPHTLSSADLGDHIAQLSDEVDKRFGSDVRTYALSQPGTPSGSGFRQRAKAAAGLENFGRSLLFGVSGAASSVSSAGISSIDVFGSPARRSNSNASKSTLSSNAASINSRGTTMSTAGTSISSRSAAFDALSRGGTTNSPGSFRRFGRRRSSSVGPPSSTASRCGVDSADEDEDRLLRRARAATPDPISLLSTSAGAPSLASPLKTRTGTLVGRGVGGHVRARTESAAPTAASWSPTKSQAPYQQRQRADSVELSRTPSSAGRRPTGPREPTSPSPAPCSATKELQSQSWLNSGPTTPLNIRRKPAPTAALDRIQAEDDGVATVVRTRPVSSMSAYDGDAADRSDDSLPRAARRRVSGTKRPLSSSDADVAEPDRERSLSKRPSLGRDDEVGVSRRAATLPRSTPLAKLSTDMQTDRPSISESETSTERGHGESNKKEISSALLPAKAPVAPARTSSTISKSQEARRRNEAMEHGLRLVKEEMNLLRCDVEILQSSMAAMEHEARTPRKRRADDSTVLKELDFNATASMSAEVDHIHSRIKKLNFLFSDVDSKWISSIRMHNRIVHDLNNATTALASASAAAANAAEPVRAHSDAEAALNKEKEKLEIQVSALKRKCELLTTLEADGRLENTEIHKAFNEELDMLYDHTQTPENDELAFLRQELKRTKADQHQLMVENKRLKRDLAVEQTHTQTYKVALANHGLL
ncbi:DH domain-containing protein [Pseudozyma hubeiensis]|nr:DH domain-containing protein [Pseudozyma hubeiensis]